MKWRKKFRVVFSILAACLLLLAGCGYGEVSPTAYELAKSLYNISNRQLPDKLDLAKEKIDAAQQAEEISSQEAQWLHAIVQRAEKKDWTRAMRSARRIMEDQVSR